MCVEFSDPDEDRYALYGWGFDVGLMDSSGAKVLYLNTNISHRICDMRGCGKSRGNGAFGGMREVQGA